MSEQTQFGRDRLIKTGDCDWITCDNEFIEPAAVQTDFFGESTELCEDHKSEWYFVGVYILQDTVFVWAPLLLSGFIVYTACRDAASKVYKLVKWTAEWAFLMILIAFLAPLFAGKSEDNDGK